jgi:glutathione peroxidase
MRIIIILFVLVLSTQISGQNKNLYDFMATTITGEPYDFSQLEGKKVLIVNTASECMLTPQFKKLQELYEEYGGDDFEIIGFPCNDFGSQDPAGNDVIYDFCTKKYEVTFTMMGKIEIKGENAHPLYKWLTTSEENGVLDAKVTWNFQKFLIDEKGEIVDFVPPVKSPKTDRIMDWLNDRE